MKFSIVDDKTYIITVINFRDLRRRVTLKTLNVLNIRSDLNAEN